MKATQIEENGVRYLAGFSRLITDERIVNELLALCYECEADRILIREEELPDAFFDLKSGVAGTILQKFATYMVKVALVVSPEKLSGRFGEVASESLKNNYFRVFRDKLEAASWLTESG